MCFEFFMELCQTLEEKGVYHGLDAIRKAVSKPTRKEQSTLPSQHLPHPETREFNGSCFYWLLELCCSDQPHPPPAPSFWMRMKKEKRKLSW